MSIKKLAGQTAVYGISSMAARFLNFLIFPYFTYNMLPEEYGVVTDLYGIIPFALVVLTMGLESGYFRFAGKEESEAQKRTIFANTWGAVSLAAVVFFALVMLLNGDIAGWLRYENTPSFIWIAGAIIATDVFLAIPFARLREQGRATNYAAIRFISVVINLLLCLFFYSLLPELASTSVFFDAIYDPSFGAGYVLVANLIASFATIFLLLPACGRVMPRIDKKVLIPIFVFSLPLLISGIAGTANEFIDRQMIKYIMPSDVALAMLGQFGAVSKLGVILVLFLQMYRMGAEPYFLGSFKGNDFVKMNATAMKYYVIAAIGIFLGVTLFTDIFAYLLGPAFREHIGLLPIILVSNILTGVIFNLSFWYKQMSVTKFAIVVTGTGLIFTIIFSFLLIPTLGILGAVLARLICEFVMVGVSYALNRKYCPVPYALGRMAEYALLGAAFYGVGYFTGMLPVLPKYLCNLALLGLYGLWFVRREEIDLAGMVRSIVNKKR